MYKKMRRSDSLKELVLLISFMTVLYTFAITVIFFPSISKADDKIKFEKDFGSTVESALNSQSSKYFGIKKPLQASASATTGAYRTESQLASDQILLAEGLKAEYVTRNAGNKTDMIVLWPEHESTHLITCVEGNREDIGLGKMNPSVQRIDLRTGNVETLLRGMNRCDGIRSTAWNTVLATEEADDGRAYEIAKPLLTTENRVVNRDTGEISGATAENIIQRNALPTMAWEGLTILDSGIIYAGDELRPGTAEADANGGSVYKFIPDTPWNGESGLGNSPLAFGNVYALQVTCQEGRQQFGQGCEIGKANWIGPINPFNVRDEANALQATGYYRPEDSHRDQMYVAPENFPSSVRFCWTNTGNETAKNFAEVMCAVDHEPATATVLGNEDRLVTINRFIEGDEEFNSFDNLAFQPKTGNLYVIEDHPNGDIFACLPDGTDRDIKSDGCIKVLSVKDSSAEPSGFVFSNDGKTAYVSIQHSNDQDMPNFDDYPTDDVLKITGFSVDEESRNEKNLLHHDDE